jgi:hypothetical protein
LPPLIGRIIGLVNLSGSVTEVSEDTDVAYLHATHACIPTPHFKKRKLNFLMLGNNVLLFVKSIIKLYEIKLIIFFLTTFGYTE